MKKLLPRHRNLLIVSVLVLATLIVYWDVQHHGFVNYDDGKYITDNAHVKEGLTWDGFRWAITTTHANFWHPLTWLSHMLDCQLFGLNGGGHHLSGLLLHLANTVLLFMVLLRMTHGVWQSTFVAALFALHPLHVESVAWASERKDVLSTFFWILTMGAYLSYVEGPTANRYFLVVLCFVLGLMAKPMLVTLPFVLLLLDYWPLCRFRKESWNSKTEHDKMGPNLKWQFERGVRLLNEKIPLLILAVAASAVAFIAQETGGATKSLALFPIEARLANGLLSYVAYLEKTFWPSSLTVFYPHPGTSSTISQVAFAGFLLLLLSVCATRFAKSHPYFLVGWLWYLGTLVPVLGLVQVGDHGMADRYTYVPLIGVFIAVSWGLPVLLKGWLHGRTALATIAPVLLAMLMVCSWYQVGHWENSLTLFEHALRVRQPSPLAHTDLGVALAEQGNLDQAVWHYSQALRINPAYLGARVNLGSALARQGKHGEAIAQYEQALQTKPDLAAGHFNMANALTAQGRLDAAISHYKEAIRIAPNDPDIHNNLGIALARLNRPEEAGFHFRAALRIKPDFEKARHNLAVTPRRPSGQNSSLSQTTESHP
jgi:tetratricopeptide (TPR) repeat protein